MLRTAADVAKAKSELAEPSPVQPAPMERPAARLRPSSWKNSSPSRANSASSPCAPATATPRFIRSSKIIIAAESFGSRSLPRRISIRRSSAQPKQFARAVFDELSICRRSGDRIFRIEGRLLANEMAPRVHNSGHWTIEGAITSQFENHLRAVLVFRSARR